MMETLFLCSRELVKKQGRGYKITIFGSESTILLFWVGRDYEITDNGGIGIWNPDAAIIFLYRKLAECSLELTFKRKIDTIPNKNKPKEVVL